MTDMDIVRDSQTWIDGVGVIEFTPLEKREMFTDALSQFTDKPVNLDQREAHPQITRSKKGYGQKIEIPKEYSPLFDYIFIQPFVETHQVGEVTLYGVIDGESFKEERARQYQEQHQSENIGHAGQKALRIAEKDLSDFLKEEVGLGLFTEEEGNWARNSARNQTHPSFWVYDMSDIDEESGVGYLRDHVNEFTYLGLGTRDNQYEALMEFYNGQCAMIRNTRDYFITDLGSFPFRHVLTQFEPEDSGRHLTNISILDNDLDFMTRGSSDGLPKVAGLGVAELARLYNWIFWAFKSYHDVSNFAPKQYVSGAVDFDDFNSIQSDTRKYELLNEVQEGRYELRRFWNKQQQQFDSIETLIERRRVLDTDSGGVIEEPLSQGRDVQMFAQDKVSVTLDDYGNIIQRLKDDLEISLSLDVKRLTWIVIVLTIGSIVGALLSSWTVQPFSVNLPYLPETSALWAFPFVLLLITIVWLYVLVPLRGPRFFRE